ncbi:endonuclease/exonuclease/phosphatase family protein [Novosphingobium sp.]|uniref:endonuclease/exonuclease/phosphatase family protein n=1 Tax=Novosphingobium sp. TaxID=1874826 RepID=UPI0025DFC675|nr:endonuclease/exonuclease/phosphatase family protein [Novosphingobium sp.]MCC6925857.1 endonuclease/exonuclease/phosphatase family protein [Novosphingobium sp.]
MRIVSWNCNGGLRRKTELLDALNADILVVQECEDPSAYGTEYRDWAGNHLWIGDLRSKGLGIFARSNLSLEPLDWCGEDFRLFLPARIGDKFELLGVWTQSTRPASAAYIGQLWGYLLANHARLGPNAVICGDFNSNRIWDRPRRTGNHSHVVAKLAQLELTSLYHQAFEEDQGAESVPTFYLYRKPDRPFHIDYIFAHQSLVQEPGFAFAVGRSELWLTASDHMPLVADLKF